MVVKLKVVMRDDSCLVRMSHSLFLSKISILNFMTNYILMYSKVMTNRISVSHDCG